MTLIDNNAPATPDQNKFLSLLGGVGVNVNVRHELAEEAVKAVRNTILLALTVWAAFKIIFLVIALATKA